MAPSDERSGHQNERDSRTRHAFLKLHGGGPKITLRNERADIIIR